MANCSFPQFLWTLVMCQFLGHLLLSAGGVKPHLGSARGTLRRTEVEGNLYQENSLHWVPGHKAISFFSFSKTLFILINQGTQKSKLDLPNFYQKPATLVMWCCTLFLKISLPSSLQTYYTDVIRVILRRLGYLRKHLDMKIACGKQPQPTLVLLFKKNQWQWQMS